MKKGGREGREIRKGEMEMALGRESEQVDEDGLGRSLEKDQKKRGGRRAQR